MEKVTLHVNTEPYEGKDSEGVVTFTGNKVTGEVKRGEEVLYTKTVVTDDSIESVCDLKDFVAAKIELWAVHNTNYAPNVDTHPPQ